MAWLGTLSVWCVYMPVHVCMLLYMHIIYLFVVNQRTSGLGGGGKLSVRFCQWLRCLQAATDLLSKDLT